MSEQQQPKPIYALNKLQLFTPTPNMEGKSSSLVWQIREGNPRITVFTQDTDGKNIVIDSRIDPVTFVMFLNLFLEIAKVDEPSKHKIECDNVIWVDGKKGDKVLASEIWFGKDNEGILWISIHNPSKPRIKFEIVLSNWHRIFTKDGKQLDKAIASKLQTVSMIEILKSVYMPLIGTTKVAWDGTNKNNKSQNYKTTQSTSKSTDSGKDDLDSFDDIPY